MARIEVLERLDKENTHPERLRSGSSDGTTRGPGEDGNRQLYNILEATLARLIVLEERRDICYRNAFKAAVETDCIVRGCGGKLSRKNDLRHVKTTGTPEHEVAAIILQQKECLQCGEHWKSPAGLDHHEQTFHGDTRSSRIDTFQPYLEQPLCK